MPIYTKLGDTGETRLFDGSRVSKRHPRVEAYGQVDELNSALGAAGAFIPDQELRGLLVRIQKHLMALGADLANPADGSTSGKGRLDAEWVRDLEASIDGFESELPPLHRFILSGGSPGGAWLHLARTICRRAERAVVGLTEDSSVKPEIIEYLNRLSDLLFVLARVVNHREGIEEVQW